MAPKMKKKRASPTKFNDQDLEGLKAEFAKNPSPRSSRTTALATQLSYTDQIIPDWFSNRRKKVRDEEKKKIADLAKLIENPDVEVIEETPARKRLREIFSVDNKKALSKKGGSYVIVHTPTLKAAKIANYVPEMLKSIAKAGNFHRMSVAERMFDHRDNSLKNDKNNDYNMLLVTYYDESYILPNYALGRLGLASTSDEYFIMANWESFSNDFKSILGYGVAASAVTDDIVDFGLAEEYKDSFLELITQKLFEENYVDEEVSFTQV